MDATRITPKPNGPLIVEGPVKIVTPDGRELPVPPRKDGRPAEVVFLCRWGGPATKPLCDGTHKRNRVSDHPQASPPATPSVRRIMVSTSSSPPAPCPPTDGGRAEGWEGPR